MFLDTGLPLGTIEPDADTFRETLVSIAKHSKGRGNEEEWASHLRFLTPSLEEGMVIEDPMSSDSNRSTALTTAVDIEGSIVTTSDEDCTCTDFPSRRFQLQDHDLRRTNPINTPDCCHYVAVSYCWESSGRATYLGDPYRVEVAGRCRGLKCPPSLLERVIVFANFYRSAFVWIDQECIDQDNPADKQSGIQAMDLVYQRASYSVAVLEACLAEQRQVDALEVLFERGPDEITAQQLLDLVEALETIIADPWFERAWTLQESTSGSRQMRLIVRCDMSLDIPDNLQLPNGDIELEISQLHNLLSSWIPLRLAFGEDIPLAIVDRCNRLVEQWFEAMVPDVSTDFNIDSRTVCNGAEAMAYLSGRKNSVISDRLAIIANLCQYDIRLDTMTLDEAKYSFSICAIVLSALNGDLSMMTGLADVREGRKGKLAVIKTEETQRAGHGFSWCMPRDLSLDDGIFLDKDTEILKTNVQSLSLRGLGVRGCLWTVDRVIDVDAVRQHLFDKWDEEVIVKALEAKRMDPYVKDMSRVRAVKVAMAVNLICHLVDLGFSRLAEQFWSYLRLHPTSRQLEESQEVRDYAEASLETIVNTTARTFKWSNPIPLVLGAGDRSGPRPDPFESLASGLPQHLLTKVIEDGRLVIARPSQSEAKPYSYAAIFESANIGDCVFSPESNFGTRTPRQQYGWYPMCWKVEKEKPCSNSELPSLKCQSLVVGNWEFDESCMRTVFLK